MPAFYLIKELSRYPIGTWTDIIYRSALLFPEQEASVPFPRIRQGGF
jgi:hypothetical protein